jgi:RNA polymerase sigma-70 factor (ECF subfamily)
VDDRSLVAEFLASRNERVFRELYRRHTPALYAVALRFAGGDETVAREVVQDAWIRSARALPGFEWRSSLRTWLIGIVTNCHREHLRSQRQAPVALPAVLATAGGAPAAAIDLERAITALPPGYREVFVLYHVHGYSHQEIGDLLGISEGTSKSQLSRARAALRAALEPNAAPSSGAPAEGRVS